MLWCGGLKFEESDSKMHTCFHRVEATFLLATCKWWLIMKYSPRCLRLPYFDEKQRFVKLTSSLRGNTFRYHHVSLTHQKPKQKRLFGTLHPRNSGFWHFAPLNFKIGTLHPRILVFWHFAPPTVFSGVISSLRQFLKSNCYTQSSFG